VLWRTRSHFAVAAEILLDRNLEAGRAVQDPGPEGARQRRLLLLRFELDQAGYPRRATVVDQAERVHRPERLAHGKHCLGQRIEIARFAKLFGDFRFHPERMLLPCPGVRLSQKA